MKERGSGAVWGAPVGVHGAKGGYSFMGWSSSSKNTVVLSDNSTRSNNPLLSIRIFYRRIFYHCRRSLRRNGINVDTGLSCSVWTLALGSLDKSESFVAS